MKAILMFYFDANATTPLHPAAREAWLAAQDSKWGNPLSPSGLGVRAHTLLEDCRSRLATRLPGGMEVVFTGGATEGNNAVLADAARRAGDAPGARVAVSAIEHASVAAPAARLFSAPPLVFPVNSDGVTDIGALETLLAEGSPPPALVSLMAVNNETGVLQPVQAARLAAARYGIPFHCDASQAFGKLAPASLRRLLVGCDFVTGCAHKFGGPKGLGFLAFNSATHPHFQMQAGGEQENHRRAGTSDVPGVAAMLTALEATDGDFSATTAASGIAALGGGFAEAAAIARLRFEARICAEIPGARVNGASAPRVWNTVSLTLPEHENLRWMKQLERRGFVAATGSACASGGAGLGASDASHVLLAMGISPAAARRTLRLSVWRDSPLEAWDLLAAALLEVRDALESAPEGIISAE